MAPGRARQPDAFAPSRAARTRPTMNRRTLSLAATAATLITAPASAALAAQPPAGPAPPAHGTLGLTLPGPHDTVSAKLQAAARPELVEDVVRLTHKRERLHGRKARRGLRQELSTWTPARLRAHNRALRHEIRERRR